MRSGIIIAVIAAIVLIGGAIWYNNNQAEHARIEQQRIEQAAQTEREAQLARDEEDARQADEAEGMAEQGIAVDDDETAVGDDDVIVVGDEITEDTIVVESTSGEPTILDADDTATSTEIIDDAGTGVMTDGEVQIESDATAVTSTPTEPGQLLTPETFDRDEVLLLIDNSGQLSDDERSTLRALVEGASANPDMVEATIEAIRSALDLPPLN